MRLADKFPEPLPAFQTVRGESKTYEGFVEATVDPATEMVVTDAWQGYAGLARAGYRHLACPERGELDVAEDCLPIVHLIFSNLKAWLSGVHHGVSTKHLQAYSDRCSV